MLKRTKKIRQYTAILKAKRSKQTQLKNHQLLRHKINEEEAEVKEEHESHMEEMVEEDRQSACWNDSEDEQEIQLPKANKFKKFASENMAIEKYEAKLAKFYTQKFQKNNNWAQEGSTIEEKDVNDYLNEEVFYGSHNPTKKVIKFLARTHEKHDSIISGLDWHNNVMFSCGLDHKVKVWSFHPKQENPDMKLQKEKDMYFADLPLSNCAYREGQLVMGSLRKNIVLLDCEKWVPTYITSNFLKQHRNYENTRVSKLNKKIAIFDGMRASILDKNNVYAGSILANEEICDLAFNENNQHLINAVTADAIYQWDLRKYQVCRLEKKYLNFTSLTVNQHSITAGSKLGTVYIFDANNLKDQGIENSNLVTHISQVKQNSTGDLLLAISKWKSNGMRVLDGASGKSIGEWPGPKTKVGLPMQACFNQSNNFSVGSSHGYASIFGFSEESI